MDDLISREVVENYVDNMPSELTEDGRRMIRAINVKEFIADCPSAFEGMTVGEALKVVFPNAVIRTDDSRLIVEVLFSNEVWKEPYKGGE